MIRGVCSRALHARTIIICALVAFTGCPKQEGPATDAPPPTAKNLPPTRDDTRFVKIRNLLSEPPESRRRATELYPLVKPICTDAKERKEFLDVAKWSVSFSTEENQLPTNLAADTFEHVATSCFRTEPEAALQLLDEAAKFLGRQKRLDVIRARLLAARGDLEAALAASKAAADAGSVHAIALTANIQAQIARAASTEYRAGMLDEAIRTVSVEPTNEWMAIDLNAVLSTKARLLSERAIWEDGDDRKKTLLEAGGLYKRLSVAPFVRPVRTRALDNLCFDGDADACRRAAEETRNLGAAVAAKIDVGAPAYDQARYERIRTITASVAALPPNAVVLWIARGDESEVLEWVRPAAVLLETIAAKKPRVVVVDRTSTPRAGRLITRTLELAKVKPHLTIAASGDTFAMPCVTAILADRRTPTACPLDDATKAALGKARPYGLAVLFGRDLDAELDDLALYELPSMLLSFRQSLSKKGASAHLKSVSDVRIIEAGTK